jgi:hypothetical protein
VNRVLHCLTALGLIINSEHPNTGHICFWFSNGYRGLKSRLFNSKTVLVHLYTRLRNLAQ